MNYRVYNEKNYSEMVDKVFPTYFKTKKEALAYAEQIGNATVEKKIGGNWVLAK